MRMNTMIGNGKSTMVMLNILFDLYVEETAIKYSKYRRIPRKTKKRLSANIRNRIKEIRDGSK